MQKEENEKNISSVEHLIFIKKEGTGCRNFMQMFLEMIWEICQHFPFYYLKTALSSAPLWEFKMEQSLVNYKIY